MNKKARGRSLPPFSGSGGLTAFGHRSLLTATESPFARSAGPKVPLDLKNVGEKGCLAPLGSEPLPTIFFRFGWPHCVRPPLTAKIWTKKAAFAPYGRSRGRRLTRQPLPQQSRFPRQSARTIHTRSRRSARSSTRSSPPVPRPARSSPDSPPARPQHQPRAAA